MDSQRQCLRSTTSKSRIVLLRFLSDNIFGSEKFLLKNHRFFRHFEIECRFLELWFQRNLFLLLKTITKEKDDKYWTNKPADEYEYNNSINNRIRQLNKKVPYMNRKEEEMSRLVGMKLKIRRIYNTYHKLVPFW